MPTAKFNLSDATKIAEIQLLYSSEALYCINDQCYIVISVNNKKSTKLKLQEYEAILWMHFIPNKRARLSAFKKFATLDADATEDAVRAEAHVS